MPVGHPDPRPLVFHGTAADADPVQPLRKVRPAAPAPASPAFRAFVAHGEGVYQLPVGPIHAGIIEPGHFRFSAVGESVLHLDARLFYTHRGIEQLVEGRSFAGALAIVERACGVCTVTHATAFSQAVERLSGTEIPPHARMARILLAELERLYNHVSDLGNICAGVGFHFGTSRLGWQKERLLRCNEALTGHRYLTGMVAPGGLRLALDEQALAGLDASVKEIDHDVRAIVRHLVRSESFMGRLHGTGIVREVQATAATGVSGLGEVLARRGLAFNQVFMEWARATWRSPDSLAADRLLAPGVAHLRPWGLVPLELDGPRNGPRRLSIANDTHPVVVLEATGGVP